MGVCYYFYKSDIDKKSFEDAKFAGIPDDLSTKYGLESINHYRVDCPLLKSDQKACSSCDCSDKTRYKITRESSKEIAKDMITNQTLFDDFMDSIGQDFIWVSWDY